MSFNNIHLIFLQKKIIIFLLIIIFFFIQISLNFLSIFSISQPYLMIIFLFLLIQDPDNSPSGITLIFLGVIYDFITGTHLGVHSLFFFLIKFFTILFEDKLKISENYGNWIVFSIVYTNSLLIVKIIFCLTIFKIPDLYSVSFNLGCTLLFFPIIKFLFDLPKNLLRFLYG